MKTKPNGILVLKTLTSLADELGMRLVVKDLRSIGFGWSVLLHDTRPSTRRKNHRDVWLPLSSDCRSPKDALSSAAEHAYDAVVFFAEKPLPTRRRIREILSRFNLQLPHPKASRPAISVSP